MKAAFITAAHVIELRQVDRPLPGAGEALVKVGCCGICGTDLQQHEALFPLPPFSPGHEISGEVVALGDGISQVRVGDRVVMEGVIGCGDCWACRTGNYQLCAQFSSPGLTRDGGFAEYISIPARALYALPAALDWELGTLSEPLGNAVHAVRQANVRGGDRVVILGAGTIGLMCVAAAKASGAAEVWITARYEHQKAAAEGLGASRVFLGRDSEFAEAAKHMLVDAVVETVGGNADTLSQAVQVVRPGGSVAIAGAFHKAQSLDVLSLMMKEVHLVGSMGYNRYGQRTDFDVALQLLAAEPERFRKLITHRFPLDQLSQGFETAANKRSGSIKVVIQVD